MCFSFSLTISCLYDFIKSFKYSDQKYHNLKVLFIKEVLIRTLFLRKPEFQSLQAPLQLNPLQLINQIMSRIKFLNSGIDLYRQIEKIKKEENVKAKYCPQ